MHNALSVRVVQRVGGAGRQFEHPLGRQQVLAHRMMVERGAFKILHGEIGNVAVFSRVVDRDDMRVIQAAGRFCFALELGFGGIQVTVAEFFRQSDGFNGNLAVDFRVNAEIDRRHGASTQGRL
jgi:hypothetical protein